MLKPLSNASINSFLAIVLLITFSSCGTRRIAYFRDIPDSTRGRSVPVAEFSDPLIQPDDVLSITVQTIDPQASAALNQPATFASETQSVSGFLVDKSGNVEIPMLGVINLAGLTTVQAREKIRQEAAKFYREPTVQVRFANYKITVLGEVNRPASFTLPNEKISVLDALAMAGDVTVFSKMNNVMLIRDNGKQKDIHRLDLTSSKLMQSPYFYMKKNDVLYVEANRDKVASSEVAKMRFITISLSVISLLTFILTRF